MSQSQIKCQHGNHKHKCYGESIYSKVDNQKRLCLLNLVKIEGKSLKEASKLLDINYSTAKTILRVYRIENRILKKAPLQKAIKKIRCSSTDLSSDGNLSHTKESLNEASDNNLYSAGGSSNEIVSNCLITNLSTPKISKIDVDINMNMNMDVEMTTKLNTNKQINTNTNTPKMINVEKYFCELKRVVNIVQSLIQQVAANDHLINQVKHKLSAMGLKSFFNQNSVKFLQQLEQKNINHNQMHNYYSHTPVTVPIKQLINNNSSNCNSN
jgi:hypothetical protein